MNSFIMENSPGSGSAAQAESRPRSCEGKGFHEVSLSSPSSRTFTSAQSNTVRQLSSSSHVTSRIPNRYYSFARTTETGQQDLCIEDIISTRFSADETNFIIGEDEVNHKESCGRGNRRLRSIWKKTISTRRKLFRKVAERLRRSPSSLCFEASLQDHLQVERHQSRSREGGEDSRYTSFPESYLAAKLSPFLENRYMRSTHPGHNQKCRTISKLSPLHENSPRRDKMISKASQSALRDGRQESRFSPLPEITLTSSFGAIPLPDLGHAWLMGHDRFLKNTPFYTSEHHARRSASATNLHDSRRSPFVNHHYHSSSVSNASVRGTGRTTSRPALHHRYISRSDSAYDTRSFRSLGRSRQDPVFVDLRDDSAVNFVFPAQLDYAGDDQSIRSGHDSKTDSSHFSRPPTDVPLLLRCSRLKQDYEKDESQHKIARYVPSMILKPSSSYSETHLESLQIPETYRADISEDLYDVLSDPGSMTCQASISLHEKVDGEPLPTPSDSFHMKLCKMAFTVLVQPLPGCKRILSGPGPKSEERTANTGKEKVPGRKVRARAGSFNYE